MRRSSDILLGLFNFDSCIRIELLLNYESAATHCMIKIFYRVVHHGILFHFLVDIGMPLCYRVKFERISYKLKEYSTHHQFLRMLKRTLVQLFNANRICFNIDMGQSVNLYKLTQNAFDIDFQYLLIFNKSYIGPYFCKVTLTAIFGYLLPATIIIISYITSSLTRALMVRRERRVSFLLLELLLLHMLCTTCT